MSLDFARDERADLVKPVGAVITALAILRCIGRHREALRLSDIVREESINASTAHAILRTLEHEGLVAFDRRTKRYTLASGLTDLAAPLTERDDPAMRAANAMAAAAQELHATIGLWRRVGDEVELLHVADSSATMRVAFTIGRRLPMLLGAMGRLVAARGDFDEATLERGFEAVPWAIVPDYTTWRAEVATAQRDAIGLDHGHVNAGILGVAVPVEHDGPLRHVVAAAMFDAGPHPDTTVIVDRLRAVAAVAGDQ
ncbi:IclR family transcriptional regulator [Sphingomonas radiodurans]|uniref:IclR family transcriptional regulator n=1 Tax=Sphingomonas radiodurans TaxID=2890321 RepID=UPI001E506A56|nr:helix-turn-helix domain-containing protein [Sphingomonas radiodurans]WBH17813.1 helix-turn-helix domain-containing protein [Sphingomonas radiodurans]